MGLEVSGTSQMPDKVSFTTTRYEGAIVPRSTNGDPYSVYGGLDADVKWFPPNYTIRQTFATGRAAQIATDAEEICGDDPESSSRSPLFFVTDTSFGLKISAGKQDVSPTLLLGYKRVEGTVIPVEKTEAEARSVYADIVINSSTNETGITDQFPNNNGVRIRQSFATGKAADAAATKAEVRDALDRMAVGATGTRTDAAIHDESTLLSIFQRLDGAAQAGDQQAAKLVAGLNQLGSVVPAAHLRFDTPPPPAAQDLAGTAISFPSPSGYREFVAYRALLRSNINKLASELKKPALPAAKKLQFESDLKTNEADLKTLNEKAAKSGAERKALQFYANKLS